MPLVRMESSSCAPLGLQTPSSNMEAMLKSKKKNVCPAVLTVNVKNNDWSRTCASCKSQTAIENRRTTSAFNSSSGSWSNELVIKFGFQLAILLACQYKNKKTKKKNMLQPKPRKTRPKQPAKWHCSWKRNKHFICLSTAYTVAQVCCKHASHSCNNSSISLSPPIDKRAECCLNQLLASRRTFHDCRSQETC